MTAYGLFSLVMGALTLLLPLAVLVWALRQEE